MGGDFAVRIDSDQLCLTLTGDVSRIVWTEVWQQVEAALKKDVDGAPPPRQLLIEARVSRWPSIVQLYGWPQRLRETGIRETCRIAIFDDNQTTQRDAHFLDCVLHNQGFCFSTVCTDLDTASAWLQKVPA